MTHGSDLVTGTGSAGTQDAAISQGRWLRTLRQFFWMDHRLARALREGYSRGCPGWEEFELARAIRAEADELAESHETRASSFVLYRAAAGLIVRAQLARVGLDPGSEQANRECWTLLASLPSVATLQADISEHERELVTAGLGVKGESMLARFGATQQEQTSLAFAKLIDGLTHAMGTDAGRVRKVILIRWARIAVATLLLGLGVWLANAKIAGLLAQPNLALNRPVVVVTSHPEFGVNPGQLVDGDRDNLGFHSESGQNQNVTIDLESVRRISRVVVYNRKDCCRERSLPLRLEVSTDGKSFQQVADRNRDFARWTVELPGTDLRYLRLTNLRNDFFHLAEVEVY
jgi:hypothetical protein